jgi:hypothetical protein
MIIQLRGYSKIKVNSKDREMLVIVFKIGPIRICVNANIPDDGKQTAPFYVQVEVKEGDGWTVVDGKEKDDNS